MHLRRMRVGGAIAVGALALVVSGSSLAGADGGDGDELPPLNVSPTEGPPGTVISVSGAECFHDDHVVLKLKPPGSHGGGDGGDISTFGGDGSGSLDYAEVPVDDDGSWSGQLTVPQDDSLIGQDLIVWARCNPVYDPVVFAVIEPTPDPTTPTTPPTTPEPTTPPPIGGGPSPVAPSPAPAPAPAPAPGAAPAPAPAAVPMAPAAAAVPGTPNFAG